MELVNVSYYDLKNKIDDLLKKKVFITYKEDKDYNITYKIGKITFHNRNDWEESDDESNFWIAINGIEVEIVDNTAKDIFKEIQLLYQGQNSNAKDTIKKYLSLRD